MSDPPLSQKKAVLSPGLEVPMELHWILFVVFTLGANISSPMQVGQTAYMTKDDCLEAAAQSVFTKAGNVQAVTWCGPVRSEGALSSGPPAVIRSAPAARR
jgi:hypothetical protein